VISVATKLTAAVHEAGHITVATAFGVASCEAMIWPIGGDRWGGRIKLPLAGLPPLMVAQIAAAGIVAEAVFHCPDLDPDVILAWWACGMLIPSRRDLAGVAGQSRRDAVHGAARLLRGHRSMFQATVNRLLADLLWQPDSSRLPQ
jgi:hypothetical protein